MKRRRAGTPPPGSTLPIGPEAIYWDCYPAFPATGAFYRRISPTAARPPGAPAPDPH